VCDFYLYVAGGCSNRGGSSSSSSPLTAEPEVTQHELATNDEFVVLGCDGLWDVISSQRAVELARQRLREHNDPQRCAESEARPGFTTYVLLLPHVVFPRFVA
jgi:serine/threonine protein phosphatase PrpC